MPSTLTFWRIFGSDHPSVLMHYQKWIQYVSLSASNLRHNIFQVTSQDQSGTSTILNLYWFLSSFSKSWRLDRSKRRLLLMRSRRDIQIQDLLCPFVTKSRTWYFEDWRKPHRSIWICNSVSPRIWRSQWRSLSSRWRLGVLSFKRSSEHACSSCSNLISESIWLYEVASKHLYWSA